MNEKLQTGDYCEVTREQAIELLNIEKYKNPESYVNTFTKYDKMYVWWDSSDSLLMSGSLYYHDMETSISFPEFKQRLINTVKK